MTPVHVRSRIAVPESAWQSFVVDFARTTRWLVYHTWNSKHSAKGFPDLTLVRERVVFVEVKSERGRLTPDQIMWRDRLLAADAEWYLWRPSDREEVIRVLR